MKTYFTSLNKQKKTLILLSFFSVAVYMANPLSHAEFSVDSSIQQTVLVEEAESASSGAAEMIISEVLKNVITTFLSY